LIPIPISYISIEFAMYVVYRNWASTD